MKEELSNLYRKLRKDEILTMEAQGCSCKDWSKVLVKNGFIPERVRESSFSGYINWEGLIMSFI